MFCIATDLWHHSYLCFLILVTLVVLTSCKSRNFLHLLFRNKQVRMRPRKMRSRRVRKRPRKMRGRRARKRPRKLRGRKVRIRAQADEKEKGEQKDQARR